MNVLSSVLNNKKKNNKIDDDGNQKETVSGCSHSANSEMSNSNSCRLCFSTENEHYLSIFSDIGIEMKMNEIISEHFKCDVNKKKTKTFFFLVELDNVLVFLYTHRSAKWIRCRISCARHAGRQRKPSMSFIKNPKAYKKNFSIQ